MKIIISESQYTKLISENKRRTEFPGIDFFNGNWKLIFKHLDMFTFDGNVINNLIEYKGYLIDKINEYANDNVDIDLRDYYIWYNNEHVRFINDEGLVTTSRYEEDNDQDEYKAYYLDELPYDVLKEIYDIIL
jgi:hypothetical protein